MRSLVLFMVFGSWWAPAAFLAGCKHSVQGSSRPPAAPAEVRVVQPGRGEVTRSIALPATVHAYQEATLYAKVAGYLKSITVDKGDAIQKGAVLAEIEVPELLADLASCKAEVEVAEIECRRIAAAQQKAPDLVVPQAVDAAKGKLDVAKARLQRVETLLGFAKIAAPFSGIITWRGVDPGAFIPAATSGTAAQNAALIKLMDFSRVRVQVPVPEPEVPLITKGLPAQLSVAELPGRIFEGTVTRYSYSLDSISRTMLAEIELPNPQGDLRPGMYGSVSIVVERKPDAFLLPTAALVQEKGGSFVFTVCQGMAKKTRIKTGFADEVSVEVLEGLKADDTVILAKGRALADGQQVRNSEAP